MRSLTILRHAKSSWADPSLADFDRPLATRGEKAAPLMGAFLAEHGLVPDLILCSSSQRTRQTLDLALTALSTRPETIFEDNLYHATVPALLRAIQGAPDAVQHLMVIGHNPGLQSLLLELTGSGSAEGRKGIAHKFPTCAIAVLTFEVVHWSDVQAGSGNLNIFITPRQLRDASK